MKSLPLPLTISCELNGKSAIPGNSCRQRTSAGSGPVDVTEAEDEFFF
jgi:hypothetical protein